MNHGGGSIVGSAGFSPCLACGIYPADSLTLRYKLPRSGPAITCVHSIACIADSRPGGAGLPLKSSFHSGKFRADRSRFLNPPVESSLESLTRLVANWKGKDLTTDISSFRRSFGNPCGAKWFSSSFPRVLKVSSLRGDPSEVHAPRPCPAGGSRGESVRNFSPNVEPAALKPTRRVCRDLRHKAPP